MINKSNNRVTWQIISKIAPAKEFGQLQGLFSLTRMENRLKRANKTNCKVMMLEKRKTMQIYQFL
jgi:hypothetical protein